jgi:hypothetical protein
MAATFVTVTNRTATKLAFSGDEGKPSVTIGNTAGSKTATINIGDLLGNSSLCTLLADWITDGTVSITRGSVTLTAANLTAYAQGSDMSRNSYDADDDGVVDSAEGITFASVTAETALAVGDSFLMYDLTAAATRKFTVPNALNISVLTAETTVAAADVVLIYDDTASAVRKMTHPNFMNINTLTAATVVEDTDTVLICDATDTLAKKMTVANLFARKVFEQTDLQAVAATATTTLFIAPAAGTIKGLLAVAGTAAAAGESMTCDVQIGGVTALTSVATLDDAAGTTAQTAVVNAAADDFVAGNVITVVRTYVAGGGPTPMANTVVSVWANVALT